MSSTVAGLLQVGVLLVVLAAVYRPLGDYLARVFTDERHLAVERAVYRLGRVNPESEQRWPVSFTPSERPWPVSLTPSERPSVVISPVSPNPRAWPISMASSGMGPLSPLTEGGHGYAV